MFKEINKTAKILLIIITIASLIVITGITYAYFSASGVSGNSATNNIVVQTTDHGDVIVRYDGGKNTFSSGMLDLVEGGDHLYDYIKYSVEYTGNVPQDTYMYFKDVTNTFCQYANGQTCTNDEEDTYVGDEYSYTTYYCDNETKYNNIESATDTDLSSCTIINTEHTAMPITGENKYLSTTNPITFNNASTKYYVVVARLENKDTEQNYNQGKSFTGKLYVNITFPQPTFGLTTILFHSPNNLAYKILSDPNVVKSTATPTLAKAAVTQEYIEANNLSTDNYVVENGIYQTEDDDGISYFYRGHIERNYVKFAGFIWRIVRINGDGSIRIVLDGTTKTVKKNDPANTLCSTGCAGSNAEYNKSQLDYQHDTGTGPSNAVAEEDLALEYGSYDNGNLEANINTFYETYIYNETNSINYLNYLTNSTYCSDTSWGSTSGDNWHFAPRTRLENGASTLRCEILYRYRVENGIGKLTYPIATLSADEINYAGAQYNVTNQSYFLYNSVTTNNESWWTMSPYYWSLVGVIYAYYINIDGNFSHLGVRNVIGVRPVVNLKADTLTTTGIGTSGDPYQVG